MNKFFCTAIASIILCFLLSCGSSSSEQPASQKTDAVIYKTDISKPTAGAEEKTFTFVNNFGPEDNLQPIKLTLRSYKEAGTEGPCWKFGSIEITRTGGGDNFRTTKVTHKTSSECAFDFDGKNLEAFDTGLISIDFDGRVGIKQFGGNNNIIVRADGKPNVTK